MTVCGAIEARWVAEGRVERLCKLGADGMTVVGVAELRSLVVVGVWNVVTVEMLPRSSVVVVGW